MNEMGRTCSMHGEMTNMYEVLVRKLEGKRPLQREDDFKIDLRGIGCEGMD
jgi:hypothetical protein